VAGRRLLLLGVAGAVAANLAWVTASQTQHHKSVTPVPVASIGPAPQSTHNACIILPTPAASPQVTRNGLPAAPQLQGCHAYKLHLKSGTGKGLHRGLHVGSHLGH
jgi:hypothetical protein